MINGDGGGGFGEGGDMMCRGNRGLGGMDGGIGGIFGGGNGGG